jgi:hypothetical protein
MIITIMDNECSSLILAFCTFFYKQLAVCTDSSYADFFYKQNLNYKKYKGYSILTMSFILGTLKTT